MNLDKAEISRRLLGTALALFLDDQDAVSVHTLACAGGEIAEHLTRGADPFSTHPRESNPDLDIGKLFRVLRQYYNAFKHGQIGRKGARAGASRGSRRLRLRAFSSPATITRVERFGETRRLLGITDAVETVEANPSHQVNHAIA
jgi:hypothetical protein